VSYLQQGEVTSRQEGTPDVVPEKVSPKAKRTTHWSENRGTVPAVWIAVDIPKEP
jgi:hypothetical protein